MGCRARGLVYPAGRRERSIYTRSLCGCMIDEDAWGGPDLDWRKYSASIPPIKSWSHRRPTTLRVPSSTRSQPARDASSRT
eukprot:7120606-Lingulodinium_polyedra.AAC.1